MVRSGMVGIELLQSLAIQSSLMRMNVIAAELVASRLLSLGLLWRNITSQKQANSKN